MHSQTIFEYKTLRKNDKQESLPTSGIYFVFAGNGVFQHKGNPDLNNIKDGGLIESMTLFGDYNNRTRSKIVDESAHELFDRAKSDMQNLGTITTYARIKTQKLPQNLAAQAKDFFHAVFREYNGEAELQIYYNPSLKRFRYICPQQRVSHGGVDYVRITNSRVGDGWYRAGTIHSHCDFGAFHSSTDINDEATEDGIHFTFGHVNKDQFSIAICVVSNGNRFPLDPLDCIEGISLAQGSGNSAFYEIESLPKGELDAIQSQSWNWLANVSRR